MTPISILCIGDVVGRPGRDVLASHLSKLQSEFEIDFTIANIENSASGFGFTKSTYHALYDCGIDAFTLGNHVYDKREVLSYFDTLTRVSRPLNFPPGHPGKGVQYYEINDSKIAVVNLIGRVFMMPSHCPFTVIDRELEEIQNNADIVIVDFHTEATSEIMAMGWHLSQKASVVFGTHTHVQTADDRLLKSHTAYISDLGMTGSEDSILGMEKNTIIKQFFDGLPVRKEVSKRGPFIICGIVAKVDPKTGKALSIERVYRRYNAI